MELRKLFMCLICLFVASNFARAEENYWQVIRELLEAETDEARAQCEEYVKSLTAEELIIAAKQCSVDMEASVDPTYWDVAIGNLGFFYQYYPLKADDLKDISPLLNDLEDKLQSALWRHSIMYLLGAWGRVDFSVRQNLDIANAMVGIFMDPSEPVVLRSKAARECPDFFGRSYDRSLRDDPAVKQLIKEGKRTPDVLREVRTGRIKLSKETLQRNKIISDVIHGCVVKQLELFSDPNISISLRSAIISAWVKFNKYNIKDSDLLKQVLDDAVANYRKYDEKLWHQLIRTDIVYFKNEAAKPLLQRMIDEIKDEHEKEHLIWLKKEIQKGN